MSAEGQNGHRTLACGLLTSAVKEIAGVFSAGDEVDTTFGNFLDCGDAPGIVVRGA
jgi:hypothetical protein